MTGVDWDRHLVTLEDAAPLPFDSVILASGATARYFGIPGAAEFTFPLYTLRDARILRDHILRRLEDADGDPNADDRAGCSPSSWSAAGPPGSRWPGPWPSCWTWPCATTGSTSRGPGGGSSWSTASTGC